jgi:hypothetical protein
MNRRLTVVSLFDYTGNALRPWAEAGYECHAFDIQHEAPPTAPRIEFIGRGTITFHHWDSDTPGRYRTVEQAVQGSRVVMLFGWPPCTDLAGSGARHWAAKLAADPLCQARAVERAKLCAAMADALGGCPYVIENPIGALSRLWRPAEVYFNPCDFGGYIPEAEAEHPVWPEYIAPRDAYKKLTGYWFGNGFRMPAKRAVEPEVIVVGNKQGSRQWAKLGGKSLKTKNIRSATPRGGMLAVYEANCPLRQAANASRIAPGDYLSL